MMGLSSWSFVPGTGGGSGLRRAMPGAFMYAAFGMSFR